MTAWRVVAVAALACAAVAGCGGSGHRTPPLSGFPLVSGTRVEVSKRTCDRGANAFCALQLVIAGRGYRTSAQLLSAERRLLRRRHWAHANAPVGLELAADAPDDRVRVTYATANSDLEAVDLGWIKRARPVTLDLSHAIFAHTSALSIVLELGTD